MTVLRKAKKSEYKGIEMLFDRPIAPALEDLTRFTKRIEADRLHNKPVIARRHISVPVYKTKGFFYTVYFVRSSMATDSQGRSYLRTETDGRIKYYQIY